MLSAFDRPGTDHQPLCNLFIRQALSCERQTLDFGQIENTSYEAGRREWNKEQAQYCDVLQWGT